MLGDAAAGGGLSQTELDDDPHGDGDDEFDDNDVTPLDDVEDVRLSFVGSSPGLLRIGLSSEMDLEQDRIKNFIGQKNHHATSRYLFLAIQ